MLKKGISVSSKTCFTFVLVIISLYALVIIVQEEESKQSLPSQRNLTKPGRNSFSFTGKWQGNAGVSLQGDN